MEFPDRGSVPDALRRYEMWSSLTHVGAWEMTRMRNEVAHLSYKPKISVLLPVHDPDRRWLERALDSVMSQAYPHWELCVCDDGSTREHVRELLDLYERLDGRVKVRQLKENAGIVAATNAAFSIATGKFVGLLDHDDELASHALFEVARFLQERPEADLVYTDEDKIDEDGKPIQPHFKPGWSPDFALSVNYLVHLSVYRRTLLEEVGGWREGFDGAQDLDLMLRYTERTDRIHHLPKVLYHWRMVEGSVAVDPKSKHYTHERARRAIQDALERRNVRGEVLDSYMPNGFKVDRGVEGQPKVVAIVPLREGADHSRCITSLEQRTNYPNYEVLLVTSETSRPGAETLSGRTKILQVAGDPTPLELYNAAVAQADGEYVLILDPDSEAASDGWLEALLQHAQRPEVGAVGGKLISEEGQTLQAGLILDPEEREDLPQTFYRPYDWEHPGFRMFLDLTRNCSAVSEACMMFRKETFEVAGGFDAEHLESTFGDVGLCLRLREQGHLIVYTPYAEFTQHSTEPVAGLEPEQARYVRERWREALENDPYYNPNLRWSADNLRSVLDLMGLSNQPKVATRKSQAAAT